MDKRKETKGTETREILQILNTKPYKLILEEINNCYHH